MDFKLAYEDAKKLLNIFYQSPYQVSAPFVAILHEMNCLGIEMNLKQALEAEEVVKTQVPQENVA
jgi:hypothetical protein